MNNSKALSTASRWVVGGAMLLVPLTHQRNILARRGDVTGQIGCRCGERFPWADSPKKSWGD